MSDLLHLAALMQRRNDVDHQIASIIGRPPHSGHIGEFVAAAIFGIDLQASAATKGHDGFFREGPLAEKSVNVKYGTRRDGMLNLVHSVDLAAHPDYYLVLTGPIATSFSSVGLKAPSVIHAVYLFESRKLVEHLTSLGRHPGLATSVRQARWNDAMLYLEPQNPLLGLTAGQRSDLELFRGIEVSV